MDTYSLDQPEVRQKNNWTVIALIVGGILLLICLCCIAIGGGYFVMNGNSFLSTATPVPSATPLPTKTPVPTKIPLIDEQFNSNVNGWSEKTLSDDYGDITYTINGQYVWDVKASKPVNYKTWPDNAQTASDFTLTVDAQRQSGPEGCSYGIVFRLSDSDNFYYFGVSDVGQYYVGKQVNSEWVTLVDWTDTSSISSGQVNKLKVIADGNLFTFFINGDQITTVNDETFSSGSSGLAIELYNVGDEATFVFDNFVLDAP
jgi:hypothetical protein